MLAPGTYAAWVTGDFKAAPGLTTARNGLSAFGGFARLRLTHLPLSGESPTIHQHGRQLARGDRTLQSLRRVAPPRRFFLAWCASQSHANCLPSWSRRQDLNPRQADYRSAVLPLNYTGYGAGGRNRTPIPGVEGRCSTIELHPLCAPDSGRSLHLHRFSGIARRLATGSVTADFATARPTSKRAGRYSGLHWRPHIALLMHQPASKAHKMH